MFDYRALAALSEVVRRGSFEAAAHALGVTQSAISQRIKALEGRVGQILLDRGPPAAPTDTGLRLVAHFDQVRLLEAGLDGPLGDDAGTPTIRIAVTADNLATWAIHALPEAPGLVDLVIDDQDHAESWLRAGLVSAAITAEPGPVAGCDSFALGKMRYVATASAAFVAAYFGGGVNAASLRRAPAITFNAKDGLQTQWITIQTGERIAPPTHLIPTTQGFHQAAILGMGWGMNPEILISEDLKTGRLVPLTESATLDVPLFWQVTRIFAPQLAGLTRAIRRAARDVLIQP
ncbi:LysR family transcriptional regulator ArgP [Paracoccus albus]|uniref:LysR family transcriptional regulator ArgP n=1 Tax=Paracoccus albus TaxID=3017784 RepID=UPI0022F12AEF|nr:LysR family transcriptional regulator ArgP [Paracoccus albus]WBU61120.1 LysR family transcriptional regulator ArgP [Paracoccus albus]